MIKLVCKLDKVSGKQENTVYSGGSVWYKPNDDDANELVQKNTVKQFESYESKYYYFEIYTF